MYAEIKPRFEERVDGRVVDSVIRSVIKYLCCGLKTSRGRLCVYCMQLSERRLSYRWSICTYAILALGSGARPPLCMYVAQQVFHPEVFRSMTTVYETAVDFVRFVARC